MIGTLWALLALPPIVASIIAYVLVKNIKNIKEKIFIYWLLWAAVASLVHLALGLPLMVTIAYPLLALGTGIGMIRGVERLAREGHSGRDKG